MPIVNFWRQLVPFSPGVRQLVPFSPGVRQLVPFSPGVRQLADARQRNSKLLNSCKLLYSDKLKYNT